MKEANNYYRSLHVPKHNTNRFLITYNSRTLYLTYNTHGDLYSRKEIIEDIQIIQENNSTTHNRKKQKVEVS